MSGLKVVGCCAHVATLIHYLSKAKYYAIKYPAAFLDNLLVNINDNTPLNQPIIVRNKRQGRVDSSSSESDTESESDTIISQNVSYESSSSESDFTDNEL